MARVALENLIQDGRIQSAKIEEMVGKKPRQEINKIIKEKVKRLFMRCGVFNLDSRIVFYLRPCILELLRPKCLQHSIEMSPIAGILGNRNRRNGHRKAGALALHDIGKAVGPCKSPVLM